MSGCKHNTGRGAARLDRGEDALLESEAGGRLASPTWAQAPGSHPDTCTAEVVWAGHILPSLLPLGGGPWVPPPPKVRTCGAHLLASSCRLRAGAAGAGWGEAGAKDTISTDEEDDEVNTD